MPEWEVPSPEELSSMKVDDLRERCRELGLTVSGKKQDLIDRLLDSGNTGESEEQTVIDAQEATQEADVSDAVDKLLARFEGGADPEPEQDAIEAEVMEAEVVAEDEEEEAVEEEPTPEPEPEPDPWWDSALVDDEEQETTEPVDQASMTIVLPSFDVFFENWKPISAVLAAVMLAGVGAFYFFSADPSFQARQLKYGDEMSFQISEGEISIEGDEMISLLRDAASPSALDEICDELAITIDHGDGDIAVREGTLSDIQHASDLDFVGAVNSPDAYGRDFLTAEQSIDYDLNMDLTFRTVTSSGECGGKLSSPDNTADISLKRWVEITGKEAIRSDLLVDFTDNNGDSSNVQAIIYDLEELSGLNGISPLMLPLTPIELHDVFGDSVLTEGSSWNDDPQWNSDWRWTVGSETKSSYGNVYPITMWNQDVNDCLGHATMELKVKSSSPWPVEQTIDILIDKSLETSNCGFIAGTLSSMSLPEGTIKIKMKISEQSSNSGSKDVEWYSIYESRPGPGEDKPSSSSQRQWVSSMPDESVSRNFDLEEAIECTRVNHSTSELAIALDSTGYIWQAYWSQPTRSPQWNMSWVNEDDRSGWAVVREIGSGCDIIDYGTHPSGTFSWNREAVPDTHTMSLLEQRLLDDLRYAELNPYLEGSQGSWLVDVQIGYLLTSPEEGLLSGLPDIFADGKVTILIDRNWGSPEDGGREHTLRLAMDAETGRMAGWVHTNGPSAE
ncbi:MAG: SAP domain-containing protein [Candidatus Thermoplasmatota archaeon]|nr:SAP domain-containing protein [Candidatus Thermoplasmatota archaeon]